MGDLFERFAISFALPDGVGWKTEWQHRHHVQLVWDPEEVLHTLQLCETCPVATDSFSPCRQQHRLDRTTGVGDGKRRLVDGDDDRRRGLGDVRSGPDQRPELSERVPILDHDEVPRLLVGGTRR
jgi:hypothetical protein